ncbi:MAG: DUF4350 domain-containing protein [Gemmatimonadales bacterium]
MTPVAPKPLLPALAGALALFTGISPARGQAAPLAPRGGGQVGDTAFTPTVEHPEWAPGAGPLVLLDEAHHNFHTTTGRYATFATLLRRDGMTVAPNTRPFSPAGLAKARVLVIANALGARNAGGNWNLPTPSAFTAEEIAAVRDWVTAGGSLLLIADHMPFPGAAADLAAAFGVTFQNGFATDRRAVTDEFGFRRADGSLGDHVVTRGRTAAERVDSVRSFTGQAFAVPAGAVGLLRVPTDGVILLPDTAWRFSDRTRRVSSAGMVQGALLRVGRGRVALFGEAAMFSAQVTGPDRHPFGMNAPNAGQNARFLLNVMHWLTGRLPD